MTTIKLVELNNKSRQGLYLYIKSRGNPSRYYKFKGNEGEIEAVTSFYNEKYSKVTSKERYQTAYEYVKKIKKRGSIANNLKKGISTTTISNALSINNTLIKKAKYSLLKNLVKDKDLMNIIAKDENFNKLKNRLDYQIIATDSNGNTLIEATVHGKTLNEAQNEIKKALSGNTQVEKHKYRFLNYLKKLGWEGERKASGNIKNITLKVNLRRG